jgi:hypothetical protein
MLDATKPRTGAAPKIEHEAMAGDQPTHKPPPPGYPPLHKHGAFDDLQASLSFIMLGVDALKGLGNMMQPEHGDFQMNMAFSSNAAVVFRFFGEALALPAADAYDSMERLQRAAKGEWV